MKSSIYDLAILGGKPAFNHKLYVGRPNLGDRQRFIDRLNEIFDRNWLTNQGPFVAKFERRVAEHIGVKHCIAMCNGTIALEIAIRALGLTGEVILPAFTFIATAHALQWQEITPIFCDVDPKTHTIDPRKIERLITPRTTGIIAVHLWGRVCNIIELTEIARRNNLKLLFDAAHAFACAHNGRIVGSFGDAEVFSFHATKFIHTFEGGAITTNNDDLAAKIRLMKNFGFSTFDRVIYIGTNGKMSEISAAMGLTSLEKLEEYIETNYRNYRQYEDELADVPGIQIMKYDEVDKSNYQYVVLEVDENVIHIGRDNLVGILHAENVLARRYFYPGCHQMEPYRSYYPNAGLVLPETERIVKHVLSLPTGTAVGSKEIIKICDIIRFAAAHGKEITEALSSEGKEIVSPPLRISAI